MTAPTLFRKLAGVPRSRLESNLVPVLNQPVYWTEMVSPLAGWLPVPATMSMYLSPSGRVTTGRPVPALKTSPPGLGLTLGVGDGVAVGMVVPACGPPDPDALGSA